MPVVLPGNNYRKSLLVQAERNRNQRKQQFVSRTIFHPSFKNVSMPEAIGFLGKEGETSRWLFRPSNKGTHQISITMKVSTHAHTLLGLLVSDAQ